MYAENRSKSSEDTLKERVVSWNYKRHWLRFVPKDGVTPLTRESLDKKRKELPEYRQFAFAMLSGDVVACENKHGGLLLLKNGYVPDFEATIR